LKRIPLEIILGPDWAVLGEPKSVNNSEQETDWNSLSVSNKKRNVSSTLKTFVAPPDSCEDEIFSEEEVFDSEMVPFDRFKCLQEDLSLQYVADLVFESLLVEVKGPSDHLAYKQRLWLEILSQTTGNLKAAICMVKEG